MHCSFAFLPFTERQHEISLDWRANWKSWVEFFNFCSTSLSTDIFIHPASHRITTTESFSSLVVIVKRFASWKKESSSVLAPWELFSLSSLHSHSNVIFMILVVMFAMFLSSSLSAFGAKQFFHLSHVFHFHSLPQQQHHHRSRTHHTQKNSTKDYDDTSLISSICFLFYSSAVLSHLFFRSDASTKSE